MTWFEDLTGFGEESPEQVRSNLLLSDNTITSKVNGKTIRCGTLEMPALAGLRKRADGVILSGKRLKLREVIGDVRHLHKDVANAGALFQVASQFNLLEMTSPSVTPEQGVGIYEYDKTQGPACAIAGGAGTIYRNYFADVNGRVGQSSDNQIDCLRDFGNALGNDAGQLWEMKNGYVLPVKDGLEKISERIGSMTEPERNALRQTLRIGIQWNTQVTLSGCEHLVSQAYCSALPVAYSSYPHDLWAEFAQLVLEASYEAIFWAAIINASKTGNNKLFLTLLGGGVFGNREDWIFAAIQRALKLFARKDLDIAFVSFRNSNPVVQELLSIQ